MEHTYSALDFRYHYKLRKIIGSAISQENYYAKCLIVEAKWLRFLISNGVFGDIKKNVTIKERNHLCSVLNMLIAKAQDDDSFVLEYLERLRYFEEKTKHDIKAVEYFLKEYLKKADCNAYAIEMTHFSLTSQDTVILAYNLQFDDLLRSYPMRWLEDKLCFLANDSSGLMYGKTHGQNAVLMHIGDFYHNYVLRLKKLEFTKTNKIKFSGAIGNSYSLNRLPNVMNRIDGSPYERFLGTIGYKEAKLTSQVDYYSNITDVLGEMVKAQHIINDLCQNMWHYISIGYFKQKVKAGEVGSSTMPHKVNPILFENAEGMGKIFVNMAKAFTETLPYSRYQRDLSDSTVMRNLMACIAYHLLSIDTLRNALEGIEPDNGEMNKEIDNDYSHITEYIQLYLKLKGVHDGYEIVRDITRTSKSLGKVAINRLLRRCKHSLSIADYKFLEDTVKNSIRPAKTIKSGRII